MSKIRDAVSLGFVYQDKIFTITRQNFLKSFPGYTAFMGGKVDLEDHEGPHFNHTLLNQHPKHLARALVRETQEELGIDIERLLETQKISSIDFIGRALTPEFNPYRFNTYFFRIVLTEKIPFHHDANEIKSFQWTQPQEILDQWKDGLHLMVPPVRFFYEAMALDINFSEPLIFEDRFDLENEVPWIETICGLKQVMPLSNTVPPAERTNAFVIGELNSLLVDPSPKNETELKKFFKTIESFDIKKMMITHHHKDHHQFATTVAKKLNLPIMMSDYTYNRCKAVYGEHYFQDLTIEIIEDQDVIGKWNGEDVHAIAVPGHDEGQMSLMPVSRKWFIAGDLFQGIGTVVVGGEEGNMTKYFRTLQKVIDLAPNCVIPSHGIALGGTVMIEKTLEHRTFREEQILQMHQDGLSEKEMLSRIYFDLPEKIHKYALANIQSHLIKLKEEKRI